MTETPRPAQDAARPRRPLTAVLTFVALAAAAIWLWGSQEPASDGVPFGAGVMAGSAFAAVLVAEVRAMSVTELLETAGDLIANLFGVLRAAIEGVWNIVLGVLGWD